MARESYIQLNLGVMGTGKTHTSLDEFESYIRIHQRPVLIYDVNEEASYRDRRKFKPIFPVDIARIKVPRFYKIIPRDRKGHPLALEQKREVLIHALKNFKNGLILIEDMAQILSNTRGQDVLGELTTNRHKGAKGQDIVIHLQSANIVDSMLWSMIKVIRLHYQKANEKNISSRLPDPELFLLADKLVKNAYHLHEAEPERYSKLKYYYVFIHLEKRKIIAPDIDKFQKGMIDLSGPSEKQFEQAAEEYLFDHPPQLKKMKERLKLKALSNQEPSLEDIVRHFSNTRKRYIQTS